MKSSTPAAARAEETVSRIPASGASAIILAHSVVDFPLRTAAISTCFAMCLALLAERRPPRRDASDLRLARHIVYP